jgi:AraC family transcriptional regulator
MEYVDKLQKAIDYMENNLADELTIEEISRTCHFSVPHLYRLFQVFTGYSIMDYLRKRRVSEAAQELLNTNKRVIDIALDYGFESQEAFIRTFKRTLGITPGEYRKSCSGTGLYNKLNLQDYKSNFLNQTLSLIPAFDNREFKLLGIEEEIDFSKDFVKTIISLQEKLFIRLSQIKGIIAVDRYIAYWYYKWNDGIANQEPSIYYFAAVELNQYPKDTNGLTAKVLPKSNYAVFNEMRRGEVGGPEGYAYKVWLPSSSKELNEAIPGDLEVYSNINDIGPNSNCNIYIPIL